MGLNMVSEVDDSIVFRGRVERAHFRAALLLLFLFIVAFYLERDNSEQLCGLVCEARNHSEARSNIFGECSCVKTVYFGALNDSFLNSSNVIFVNVSRFK